MKSDDQCEDGGEQSPFDRACDQIIAAAKKFQVLCTVGIPGDTGKQSGGVECLELAFKVWVQSGIRSELLLASPLMGFGIGGPLPGAGALGRRAHPSRQEAHKSPTVHDMAKDIGRQFSSEERAVFIKQFQEMNDSECTGPQAESPMYPKTAKAAERR